VADTEIGQQAVRAAAALPARLVVGNGSGGLVERVETVRSCQHEVPDVLSSGRLHLDDDIDQHEPAACRTRSAEVMERREPSHRGTDVHRRLSDQVDPRRDVRCHGGGAIVATGCPSALTVAAQVDSDRLPALVCDVPHRRVPSESGLSAAVQEQHWGIGRLTQSMPSQGHSVNCDDLELGVHHQLRVEQRILNTTCNPAAGRQRELSALHYRC
jgi:hypothetical protein